MKEVINTEEVINSEEIINTPRAASSPLPPPSLGAARGGVLLSLLLRDAQVRASGNSPAFLERCVG